MIVERLPSIELIKRAVAAHFGTTLDAIEGTSRAQPGMRHRQIAHYLAIERSRHSTHRLGRCFNRDRNTMRWSHWQVSQRRYRDEQFDAEIKAIEARIEGMRPTAEMMHRPTETVLAA